MNIAYVGNFEPAHSTENEVRRALSEGLGHDVWLCQEGQPDRWRELGRRRCGRAQPHAAGQRGHALRGSLRLGGRRPGDPHVEPVGREHVPVRRCRQPADLIGRLVRPPEGRVGVGLRPCPRRSRDHINPSGMGEQRMDQATFSLLDAATYLGISRRSLGALVAKRSITHRRIGPGAGRVVFTRQDLDEYLDRCVVEQVEQ